MKLRMENETELVGYRTPLAAFTRHLLGWSMLIGAAAIIIYLLTSDATEYSGEGTSGPATVIFAFGAIVMLWGSVQIAIKLPRTYRKLLASDGDVLFRVGEEKLSLSWEHGLRSVDIEWEDIHQILLTRRFTKRKRNTRSLMPAHQMIVMLNSEQALQQSDDNAYVRHHFEQSPQGIVYTKISYPKDSAERVRDHILRVASQPVDVNVWQKVHFNYNTGAEETHQKRT